MAKRTAGDWFTTIVNPLGVPVLVYEEVAGAVSNSREADAKADAAQAAAQEKQAKANEATARARQKLADAAAYERAVAPPPAAAPIPAAAPAAAPSLSRPVVGAGTFGSGGKVAAADDPTNWYLIGGIAAVVAGVAYYAYSRRKK